MVTGPCMPSARTESWVVVRRIECARRAGVPSAGPSGPGTARRTGTSFTKITVVAATRLPRPRPDHTPVRGQCGSPSASHRTGSADLAQAVGEGQEQGHVRQAGGGRGGLRPALTSHLHVHIAGHHPYSADLGPVDGPVLARDATPGERHVAELDALPPL